MNQIIDLYSLKLITFTEQDALDYCLLNNINSNNIKTLYLNSNELTDISGVKLFKNLEILSLGFNEITDISVIKNLKNLKQLYLDDNKVEDIFVLNYLNNIEVLDIKNLQLESDQIQYINSLKNLKYLYCYNGFKDMSVTKQLNKNINIKIK